MRIDIIGAGFVGTTTAIVLSEGGHSVRLCEQDAEKRAGLETGAVAFHEPDIEAALTAALASGRLEVAASSDPRSPAEVVIMCVGTPPQADGSADLGQLETATGQLVEAAAGWADFWVLCVKSTVPPGTTDKLVTSILRNRGIGPERAGVAMTPEFLREGSALADARQPDRIVIGSADPHAIKVLHQLYGDTGAPVIDTNMQTAEFIKYASNAMLATRIAFANEMANLAEHLDVDVRPALEAVGLDPRIGPHMLIPGLGFGGSCFPKDLSALCALAKSRGVRLDLIDATLKHNEQQPSRVLDILRDEMSTLNGKRVALLGLAFKPHTSDVRESRAIPVYHALRAAGAILTCHDPEAGASFRQAVGESVLLAPDAEAALEGQDACVIVTAWPQYEALRPETFRSRLRHPLVVDARRLFDSTEMQVAGVRYRAIGIPPSPMDRDAH